MLNISVVIKGPFRKQYWWWKLLKGRGSQISPFVRGHPDFTNYMRGGGTPILRNTNYPPPNINSPNNAIEHI